MKRHVEKICPLSHSCPHLLPNLQVLNDSATAVVVFDFEVPHDFGNDDVVVDFWRPELEYQAYQREVVR